MNVLKINSCQQKYAFKGSVPKNRLTEVSQKTVQAVQAPLKEAIADSCSIIPKEAGVIAQVAGASIAFSFSNADKLLSSRGITHCEVEDNEIRILTGQHGYFTLNTHSEISNQNTKEHILTGLSLSRRSFGGLINYVDCVNDLKRQDIIMQGLRIHTYKINDDVKSEYADKAKNNLEKSTAKFIPEPMLFYIDNEAFYYDKNTSTAYGVSCNLKHSDCIDPKIITCKFITDDKHNLIGYKRLEWDNFYHKYVEQEYIEQQKPSKKLPESVNFNNNKILAEAFRFGNVNVNEIYRVRKSVPDVLKHLEVKAKVSEPKREDLQVVRFHDEDKNESIRICYFNADTGRSYVYNEQGKYMYQMEYTKDSEGNIVSCTRF